MKDKIREMIKVNEILMFKYYQIKQKPKVLPKSVKIYEFTSNEKNLLILNLCIQRYLGNLKLWLEFNEKK